MDINCFGQHSANVLKEIIYRKIYLNKSKDPDQYLTALKQDFKSEIRQGANQKNEEEKQAKKLPLKTVRAILSKYIDPLEIYRMFKGENELRTLNLNEAIDIIKTRLNKDLDLCARWGYSKLDIIQDDQLSIIGLKTALKSIIRSYQDVAFKQVTLSMMRTLCSSDAEMRTMYHMEDFRKLIELCLQNYDFSKGK